MKAAEDFLLVVLHSHVIAVAKAILSGTEPTEVASLAKSIVDQFVCITIPSKSNTVAHNDDRVCSYAMELLTLGLLWLNYYDSVREGDGDQIVRTWNIKASRRKIIPLRL